MISLILLSALLTCSGLGFLAGMLLLQAPAEDAFHILMSVVSRLPGYYDSSLSGIRADTSIFELALNETDAKLAKRLVRPTSNRQTVS